MRIFPVFLNKSECPDIAETLTSGQIRTFLVSSNEPIIQIYLVRTVQRESSAFSTSSDP